jgi:hypothetical protein
VAYKLELPPSSEIHHVFHVSQLKPFRPAATSNELLVQVQLDAQDVEPEVIMDRCLCKKGNAAYTQVKVKWSSLLEDVAT